MGSFKNARERKHRKKLLRRLMKNFDDSKSEVITIPYVG